MSNRQKFNKLICAVTFIIIICLSYSCTKMDEWKGTIEHNNGITVVINPKDPIYASNIFELNEELTIGLNDNKTNEPFFHQILPYRSIETDNNNNIYVLDYKADQVLAFNQNGKFILSFGKEGQGPGEFQTPDCLYVLSEEKIMIYDSVNKKISFFTFEGNLIEDISMAEFPQLFRPFPDSEGNIFGLTIASEEIKKYELFKIYPNTKSQIKIASLETKRVFYQGTLNLFTPQLFYDVFRNDKIIWGSQTKYELNVSDRNGEIIQKIIKKYDPIPISEADKENRIKDLFPNTTLPSSIKIESPKYFWPFYLITSDDKGRIFVQTREKIDEAGYIYDVFDSQGKYIVKIIIKGYPILWKRGKLYTVEDDENGNPIVKRYDVKWKH